MKNASNVIAVTIFLALMFISLAGGYLGSTSSTTMFPTAQSLNIRVEEPLTQATSNVYAVETNPSLTTGLGKGYVVVPEQMNGWYVNSVAASCYAASTSGIPTFQVYNVTKDHYMLDSLLTIDANEYDSKTALVASSLYSQYAKIYSGDMLRLDCSVAGTGTKRVQARLVIQPNP